MHQSVRRGPVGLPPTSARATKPTGVPGPIRRDHPDGDAGPPSPRRPDARTRLGHAWRLAAAGLGIGFLTGFLGVGGGFIVVPVLVALLRTTMPVAVGTSLLVISLNSAVALAARAGHGSFDWDVIVPFASLPRTGTYVLYCASGNRSAQAASIMADLDFTDVVDAGGLNDLAGAGGRVITQRAPTRTEKIVLLGRASLLV